MSKGPQIHAPKTYIQSWLSIPAKTRLALSLSVCAFAAIGLVVTDMVEDPKKKSPSKPTTTSELS
ncbi:hypothetical protein D9619_002593 [Psilocybe cf. subviscida]|uniref:Uncharacterized protein n=1 Tax=Psilocybe cf. subviscida TaxID=2480587 RepID=A0A8H5EUE1_9AGAR|nr:hypothetical protein D9619_002593 [Psilocybe cf. subviscida]